MKSFYSPLALASLLSILPIGIAWAAQPEAVRVYSSQKEFIIKPVLEAFQKATGVPFELTVDKGGVLLERLKAEKSQPRADLLVMVDAGNLYLAARDGLLTPHKMEEINKRIPSELRDPQGLWTALSVRARAIVFNPAKVKSEDLKDYVSLAAANFKGRVCLRSSNHVYNQSLVAYLMDRFGEKETENIVRGWVNNLATTPFADDTTLLRAMQAGQCDVGIVNTYYLGRLKNEDPKNTLQVFWPAANSKDPKSGVHINIYGAGVIAGSSRSDQARKLLAWMSAPEAQQMFADANFEYPANPAVEPITRIKEWGRFERSKFPLVKAGELQAAAVRLMDRAQYR